MYIYIYFFVLLIYLFYVYLRTLTFVGFLKPDLLLYFLTTNVATKIDLKGNLKIESLT